MTDVVIRTAIKNRIESLVSVPVFSLSDYVSLTELPINTTQSCILLDFVDASEAMTTIGGEGNQGWRELGTVAIHWLRPMGEDASTILAQADALRKALRGRRINDIAIESVNPFIDSGRPVIQSGWVGMSAFLSYSYHTCG